MPEHLTKFSSPVDSVLVLGNDDRVLLAIIRSLGRRNITVDAAWCDAGVIALTSRYLRQHHELPAYSPTDDAWIQSLNNLVDNHRYDLVIPCNDYAVVPLQANRDKLSMNVRWYLLDDHAYQTLFDKQQTGALARSLDVPTPEEHVWETGQRNAWADDMHYPAYVKPRSSVTEIDVAAKRYVRRIANADELLASVDAFDDTDVLLVQESFDGEGHGLEVLAKDGRCLIEMQHRRIRETVGGGSTCREVVAVDDRLRSAAEKILTALKYTGVAMFEFRVNPRTQAFVLLEVNARFWGSLPLAIAAGADFPYYLYRLLVHGDSEFRIDPTIGARSRNLIYDLQTVRAESGTVTALWHVLSMPFRKGSHDYWARDDWVPQLRVLTKILRR